jgi:hypothetical protein
MRSEKSILLPTSSHGASYRATGSDIDVRSRRWKCEVCWSSSKTIRSWTASAKTASILSRTSGTLASDDIAPIALHRNKQHQHEKISSHAARKLVGSHVLGNRNNVRTGEARSESNSA